MSWNCNFIFMLILVVCRGAQAFAYVNEQESHSGASQSTLQGIKREILKNYLNARIELTGEIRWHHPKVLSPQRMVFLGDNGQGEARIGISGNGRYAEASVPFEAWVATRVALRRLRPGEPLSEEYFSIQPSNISVAPHREFRGIILPEITPLDNLETTQSILEGQVLLSSAVQRIPDVKRGDAVKIHLISGGLTLSTLGVAQEPSYINRRIRVLTAKTKKEFLGRLQPGGVVEVDL